MTPWTPGERVTTGDRDGRRVHGTVRLVLAGGALLRVELADGTRVWRHGR